MSNAQIPASTTQTHALVVRGDLHDADLYAVVLAVNSAGYYLLCGDTLRDYRDGLAGVLGPGVLADLLRSRRPISVASTPYGYLLQGF